MSVRSLVKHGRNGVDRIRHFLGWYEPEEKLARDAQAYWDQPPAGKRDLYAHWKSGFDDSATWEAIGRENFESFRSHLPASCQRDRWGSVIEWGVGGGTNALHFARVADRFHGVDISQSTLDECGVQLRNAGITNFAPVLLRVDEPEAALTKITQPCDLFTCFYVFELLPSPAYGARILKIAHQLLRPGGLAYIQIKYTTTANTRSRRWGYRFGVANMTTYCIDEFWQLAADVGFKPHSVWLMPRQQLVGDERYAYFMLEKAVTTSS